MNKNSTLKLFLLILFLAFTNLIFSQKVDPEHKLLWRISSPSLDQDSYLFGTMHVKDKRVFNFTDSLYLKIEECKYFALEVHPDTLSKILIVDPLNAQFDAALEEKMYEDELEEFTEELEEDTGIDFSNISSDNLDLIPILFKKLFKKGKDKNTILDAHLYHIAKVLRKDIIGLESIRDHKRALRSITHTEEEEEGPNLPELIAKSKQYDRILSDLIDLYTTGNVELLHKTGGYEFDSIMTYRNNTMVNSAIPYIEDGGLFMAVGAAHIAGEEGIVRLLQNNGYTVEPVVAQFSKNVLKSELAELELEWVTENYPQEGFSISTPDHAYNYQPESISGLMTIRSYPDLGRGCLFFYSATPMFTDAYSLKDVEEELRTNLRNSNQRLLSKNVKYGKYLGEPSLIVNYNVYGQEVTFKYVLRDNYLYLQGITPLGRGKPDKKVVKEFFESLKFTDYSRNKETTYTDQVGAYTVNSDLIPQKFSQVDGSGGYNATTESINFIDQESKLVHMVTYTYQQAGYIYDNASFITNNYELNFETEGDSVIYSKENETWGGTEILIEYDDNTFLQGTIFIRGNRIYQVLHAGSISDENYEKCKEFDQGFNLVDYELFSKIDFETNNFSTQFPEKPAVDTITVSYTMSSFANKGITYSSLDLNSSLNYILTEYELSPYSTFESLDSCVSYLIDLNDQGTIISQSDLEIVDGLPSFSLQTRGDEHELDYTYHFYFSDDYLYELCLVQDTAVIGDLAREEFLGSFKPKKTYNNSLLERDSTIVKNLIAKDIFSSDTLTMIAASEEISNFKFTKVETQSILEEFDKLSSTILPETYLESMIDFLGTENPDNLGNTFTKIYTSTDSDEIQADILSNLIRENSTASFQLAKELLKTNLPKPENSWRINSIFYPLYDEPDSVQILLPEIFGFTYRDSTTLNSLYHQLLDKKTISFTELAPLHDLFYGKSKELYSILKDVDEKDNPYWSEKNSLSTLAAILSYAEQDSNTYEIFKYFEADSSLYHKLNGIEYLLRQGYEVNESDLYDSTTSNGFVVKMYDLQRQFKNINMLPDSMMNLEKFVITSALAYPEDEEYIENPKTHIIEEFVENDKRHYFIKCDYQYYEEEEIYELLLYAVVEQQEDEFRIPSSDKIYTDYYFLHDIDLESAKENLKKQYKN